MIASLFGCLLAVLSLDSGWTLNGTIPATVPGSVHIDLQRAGLIPDPMVGTNVYGLFGLESRTWRYARKLANIPLKDGERAVLKFEGVDTKAEYFLNGERLGESANMFTPVSFDVTGRLRDSNDLEVVLKPVLQDPAVTIGVLGRNREGGTDGELVRKAQHSFGWDIMPRLVTAGIWKGVTLEAVPATRFGDVNWTVFSTDVRARRARLFVDCSVFAPDGLLHAAKLRVSLGRNGRTVASAEHPLRYRQTRDWLSVADAELWWPRDAGEPALYEGVAELFAADGTLLAKDVRRVGLRTIEWQRADWRSESDPGTFRFLVNGVPVYMHGCDVTPMDAEHARDPQHLGKCLEMLVDLNCNMVRVWGGGVYESDAFYDFCDANGILVWQDFMIGNIYPSQGEAFAAAFRDEAKHQVLRLRSHPSLAIWCGNNEIDRSIGGIWGRHAPDPERERISREVLPGVLRDFDPFRPYIPSSPWWTPEVVAGTAKASQDHLWGPRHLWYKGGYWCSNTVTFVSEMGCHGCPNLETLARMMTPEGLYPWPDRADKETFNAEWQCKATRAYPEQDGSPRNALMTKQVRTMFGSVPDSLEEFVERSQLYQANALKYWIELFRSRKGRTWGLLWWNLRDGWPIVSDGVVDYWYGKKKAYEAIKSVQQPQLATVVEDGRLVAVNDRLYPVRGHVTVTDEASGRRLYDADVEIPANAAKELAHLGLTGRGAVRVEYVFEDKARVNRCLYGEPPFDIETVRGTR